MFLYRLIIRNYARTNSNALRYVQVQYTFGFKTQDVSYNNGIIHLFSCYCRIHTGPGYIVGVSPFSKAEKKLRFNIDLLSWFYSARSQYRTVSTQLLDDECHIRITEITIARGAKGVLSITFDRTLLKRRAIIQWKKIHVRLALWNWTRLSRDLFNRAVQRRRDGGEKIKPSAFPTYDLCRCN